MLLRMAWDTLEEIPILIATEKRFRILQIADLHSDEEERLNERTRAAVRAMVDRFRPHFLAVLGDVWCGDTHPEAAPMWMRRDLGFLGSLGCHWALAWGNHDYCGDFGAAWTQIGRSPNAIAPEGDGQGSFRIELRDGNGQPLWDLFFLNSGVAWEFPRSAAWFEAEIEHLRRTRTHDLPAICYFHIPTGNYQQAIDEGRTVGRGNEEVLGWGDDDGAMAQVITRTGVVRACFCGHSHKNDLYFREDRTIFAYTRATGYGGYGIEDLPKGGTVLELDTASRNFRFKSVFLQGEVWHEDDWKDSRQLLPE